MEVTEVRVRLADHHDEKLRGFCTLTFDDCFVVRDIKVIRGTKGVFVAMPSRKLTDQCPSCRGKTHLSARFCSECGSRLADGRAERDVAGRARLHADVAHPINRDYRGYVEGVVLEAYARELERSKLPGYKPPADVISDAGEEDFDTRSAEAAHARRADSRQDTHHDHRLGEGVVH